jgi:UDP-GlcNAc:undecaprenyl-phosphate GlcNAc-1-phosphate transferase
MIAAAVSSLSTFALAALGCAYLAPRLAQAARRYGVVDRPDGALKTQAEPVAYLGGLAVYLAVVGALAVTLPIGDDAAADLFTDPQVLGMLLGGTLFMAVGLLDDLTGLTARDKLLGQVLACAVLIKAGVAVHLVSLPQSVQIAITLAWVLTCCNAINLVDVHDGLAVTLAGLSALGFALLGVISGDLRLAVLAAAISGASFGFLRLNRPPARQYLGDTGALFLGSNLAMLGLMARYESDSGWMPFIAPVAFVAVPLIEVVQLILTRLRLGISPFAGSRHHIAHRLLDRQVSQKGVVLQCGALQFVFLAAALLGLFSARFEGASQILIGLLAAVVLIACLAISPAKVDQQQDDDKAAAEPMGHQGVDPVDGGGPGAEQADLEGPGDGAG